MPSYHHEWPICIPTCTIKKYTIHGSVNIPAPWMVDGMGLGLGSPGIRRTTGDHLLSQAVPVEKRLRLLPEEAVPEPRRFILEVTGESFRLMVYDGF